MNDNAATLKLLNTQFDSPHGLMNPQNVSTAYDMARLTSICMHIPVFKRIVATKTYECRGLREVKKPLPAAANSKNEKSGAAGEAEGAEGGGSSDQSTSVEDKFEIVYVENGHNYKWTNTNRLLGIDGVTGTKTGITEAAGPCLSCSFEKDGNFVIVVLL